MDSRNEAESGSPQDKKPVVPPEYGAIIELDTTKSHIQIQKVVVYTVLAVWAVATLWIVFSGNTSIEEAVARLIGPIIWIIVGYLFGKVKDGHK
jgi:hypothetical protein